MSLIGGGGCLPFPGCPARPSEWCGGLASWASHGSVPVDAAAAGRPRPLAGAGLSAVNDRALWTFVEVF
jgi:hypothetical protein